VRRSQGTILPYDRHAPHKVHAALAVAGVKLVVLRYEDRQTGMMLQSPGERSSPGLGATLDAALDWQGWIVRSERGEDFTQDLRGGLLTGLVDRLTRKVVREDLTPLHEGQGVKRVGRVAPWEQPGT
jgi:hypothetical protein